MAEEEETRTLKRQKLDEETDPQDEEEDGEEEYGEEGDGEDEVEEAEEYEEVAEDEESRLLRAAMLKVEEVQAELEKINDEASERVLQVEQEYNEKRRPIYLQRNLYIREIPDFWLNVFLQHNVLADIMTNEDSQVLSFLVALDVEDSIDIKSGYKISFQFAPNLFFEDECLVKDFQYSEDGRVIVDATVPHWKDGISKASFPQESFFRWIMRSETLDFGHTDEIGEIIKGELWQNPYKYYTGAENPGVEEEEYEDEGQEAEDYEEGHEYVEEEDAEGQEVYEVDDDDDDEEGDGDDGFAKDSAADSEEEPEED
eukprot:jgi/Botrbrau1/7466/Bobra.0095s0004.1